MAHRWAEAGRWVCCRTWKTHLATLSHRILDTESINIKPWGRDGVLIAIRWFLYISPHLGDWLCRMAGRTQMRARTAIISERMACLREAPISISSRKSDEWNKRWRIIMRGIVRWEQWTESFDCLSLVAKFVASRGASSKQAKLSSACTGNMSLIRKTYNPSLSRYTAHTGRFYRQSMAVHQDSCPSHVLCRYCGLIPETQKLLPMLQIYDNVSAALSCWLLIYQLHHYRLTYVFHLIRCAETFFLNFRLLFSPQDWNHDDPILGKRFKTQGHNNNHRTNNCFIPMTVCSK